VPREYVIDLFSHIGKVTSVWVSRNPPGFAFVDFDSPEIATRAIAEMNGKQVGSATLKVEMGRGERQERGAPRSTSYDYARGGRDEAPHDDYGRSGSYGGSYGPRAPAGPPPRSSSSSSKSLYRIKIRGLDPRTSWQDLKDVMRQAGGDVTFTSILGSGDGVAEFSNERDMEAAINAVDDTLIDGARVRVTRDYPANAGPPADSWTSTSRDARDVRDVRDVREVREVRDVRDARDVREVAARSSRRRSRSPPPAAQLHYDDARGYPPPRDLRDRNGRGGNDRPPASRGSYDAGYSRQYAPPAPPRSPQGRDYDSYAPYRDERRSSNR